MEHIFASAVQFLKNPFNLFSGEKITNDNGILVLNRSNFQKAVSQHEYLMVKFYLPYCTHCKTFAPEYLKVGKMLSDHNSKVTLAKVDADSEDALIRQYRIVRFPAIRLFKKGVPVSYNGAKKAEHIVAWLNRNV